MFVEEPENTESQWRALTQNQTYSPHVWNDAYLAAFAVAGGLQLVTFDKAFAQYQNLTRIIILLAGAHTISADGFLTHFR
jgi:predicted nucleic acid-binding protein